MRILRRVFTGLVMLVVTLAVVALFLPDSASMTRSVVVEAPPEAVYPKIAGYEGFNEWSPWYARDPQTAYEFSGPPSGVGARMTWQSEHPQVGSGSQEIVEARENEYVRTKLDFGASGDAESWFRLEPAGDSTTRVTWGFQTRFGYDLVGRYFGLVLEKMLAPDYESGLDNLEQLVESGG